MNKAVREFSGGFFRSFCLIKKNQKIKAASAGLLASCTPLFTPQTRAPRSNSDALGRSVPLARFTPTRQRPELMDNGELTIENYHSVMVSGYSTTSGLPLSYVSMRTLYCPSVKSGTMVNSKLFSVTLVIVAGLIHSG